MIVIHIGLKKAGSTSLQVFLRDNEEALQRLAVDYPRIGRRERRAHHNLASEIQGRRKFDPGCGTVAQLADYWRTSSAAALIVSSEMFEEAEPHQIAALRTVLLQARGEEPFRIALIIRDLLDLMPSSYAQKVKFGLKTGDFDLFFEERMQARRVNYCETAGRWAEVFGWESLCVRLLDRRHLLNGDLRDDFLALCGIQSPGEAATLARRPVVSNASPGWKVLEAVRALFAGSHALPAGHPLAAIVGRKNRMDVGRFAIRAGKRRGWNDDRGRYLTRAQAQRCLDVYAASIEVLNRRLPVPLPLPADLESRGFQEREFLPDASRIPAGELQAFYADMEAFRSADRARE